MSWLIGRKSSHEKKEKKEKKPRKSPLTITNPAGFVHQTHIDQR